MQTINASSTRQGLNASHLASTPSLPLRSPRHLARRAQVQQPQLVQQNAQQSLGAPRHLPNRSKTLVRAEQTAASPAQVNEPDWVPVCIPEELPKGVRKELEIDGRQVLMFWYRNQIYCTQARSPAEGAYSEGFIKAKFTQDYCIECPSTGTLFSLNDGTIKSWYPNNSVLRAVTPQATCPNMEIFPVKLTQDFIAIDVSGARFRGPTYTNKGGADTSIENNNVFAVQPTVYFDGMDPAEERATPLMQPNAKQATNPAVVVLAIAVLAAVGTVGYAIVRFVNLP